MLRPATRLLLNLAASRQTPSQGNYKCVRNEENFPGFSSNSKHLTRPAKDKPFDADSASVRRSLERIMRTQRSRSLQTVALRPSVSDKPRHWGSCYSEPPVICHGHAPRPSLGAGNRGQYLSTETCINFSPTHRYLRYSLQIRQFHR